MNGYANLPDATVLEIKRITFVIKESEVGETQMPEKTQDENDITNNDSDLPHLLRIV